MPVPTARDLLRTVVLKTNPYWPFKYSNQWPYALALRVFVRSLRTRPGIHSIYLRRVPPNRQWVPGLSDIDSTLILRRGLPENQEYDCVEFCRRTHDRLRRLFPMLGEMEILDEDELAPWLSCTAYTAGSPGWTLLHGEPNSDFLSAHCTRWRQYAINLALWIYMELLPPCLAMPDSLVRRQDVLRRIRKILRMLEPILSEAGQAHLAVERGEDPVDLMADALQAFEAAATHATGVQRSGESTQTLTDPRSGETLLLIEDGLDRETISQLLRTCQWQTAPLPLTRCLLSYRVRHYDPFDYSKFTQNWIPTHGRHPLAQIAPPGKEEFTAHALYRLASFLPFTRGDELFSMSLSATVLDRELNRSLGAALLLRTEWIPSSRKDVAERWRAEFPERSEAYEKIKILLGGNRMEEARRAAFGLFRSIRQESRDLMSPRITGL